MSDEATAYDEDALRRIRLLRDGDYMLSEHETAIVVVRRLLATIAARDAEIARLRELLRSVCSVYIDGVRQEVEFCGYCDRAVGISGGCPEACPAARARAALSRAEPASYDCPRCGQKRATKPLQQCAPCMGEPTEPRAGERHTIAQIARELANPEDAEPSGTKFSELRQQAVLPATRAGDRAGVCGTCGESGHKAGGKCGRCGGPTCDFGVDWWCRTCDECGIDGCWLAVEHDGPHKYGERPACQSTGRVA